MVPWIQIYTNLPTHPKVGRLVDMLELDDTEVSAEQKCVGMLVSLWAWAQQTSPDGYLECPSRTIAKAMGWNDNPRELVDALIESGFLDIDGDRLFIHDWSDYCLLDEKTKNRERQQRYRDRRKWEEENKERIEGIINDVQNA